MNWRHIVMLALVSLMALPDAEARVGFLPDGNMERGRIPDEFKWRLEPLFGVEAAFDAAMTEVKEARMGLEAFQGKLADPAQLASCLDLYFKTRLTTNKLTLYGSLVQDTDQKSSAAISMQEKSLEAMNALMATASFIRQEVLALDDEALERAYASQAKLKEYRPYIQELRRRRSRVLGAEAERVLSLAGDNLWAEIDLNELPSDFAKGFGALVSDLPLPRIKDSQGKEVQLTLANYNKYRSDDDRRVRRDTVELFFRALRKVQNAMAALISGQVRESVFLARSRGYDTALEAYLDKDNIDSAVYHNLISTINANLAPLHRYIRLRKRLMALKDIHIYDLYTPMVRGEKREIPYEQALRLIPAALEPMGQEYLAVLKTGMEPRYGWIDIYPHRDKGSGAFSANVYGTHPYVKMNYFNSLQDLSTLAHEYGHALHSHLSMTNQPYVTAGYVPFVAEIASTFNEKLLSDHLVAQAQTDQERMFLLNDLVDSIRTTIYRQALFAEFELAVHTAAEKGTPLTAEFLNRTYGELIRKYYGPDLTVGENDCIEWAYIPHLYYKYYVFTYATGLSSGIALAERVQRGGPEARDAYLTMLKGGSSRPPMELLKAAGVDLTTPEPIEAAAKLMDRTLERMEAMLGGNHGSL